MRAKRVYVWGRTMSVTLCSVLLVSGSMGTVSAQAVGPTMLHPLLDVRPVVSGLDQPTSMAFLGPDDLLVLEKATGRVQRVVDGAIHGTVLDLAVITGSKNV